MKNILYFLVVGSLCFSQDREIGMNSNLSLVVSRSMYLGSIDRSESSIMQELAQPSVYNTHSLNSFFNNQLMLQTESESLQLSNPLWKQMGIYGLEFAGASMGTTLSFLLSAYFSGIGTVEPSYWNTKLGIGIYCISNTLITSSSTSTVGKLLGQRGSWWKSAAVSCVGGLIGGLLVLNWKENNDPRWEGVMIFLIAPPLGATIGFNL
jgi:hypothetical protein